MMEGWTEIEFTKSILQNAIGRGNQINASEILESGKYPVIDQGKSFITGYTNEEEKLIKDGFPYIIFGDHTRCFKYVDFPFVVGADGTKVLSPNTEIFDPLFFFFQLLNLDIQNRGYNRHFKLLKEKILKLPPLPEQRKIAYILSTVQKAIEQQDKLIKTTTELKKALMQKLFTEGLYGEKQKKTEIGPVPESWEVVRIGDLGKCVTGTTPKTKVEEYWDKPEYDFIAPADIGLTKYVYNSVKQISKAGLLVSRVLPKNSVMCVCIGSSIGKVGLSFKEQSSTNQQINSIICTEKYNSIYVYYLLVHTSSYWRSHATFGPVPILNKGQFEQIKIYMSNNKLEQKGIADTLSTLDNKIEFHQKKKQTLTDLFKTLLHELMTGQRRVNEIDFENDKEELLMAAEPEIKFKKSLES